MRRPLCILAIVALLALAPAGFAQSQPPAQPSQTARAAGSRLLMVMPFENSSPTPGIDWIGDSFPEVLGRAFATGPVYIISRQERLYAFDRLGLPAGLRPSRATLYRIAQEMDVDLLVVGSYSFDGRNFTARAQLMDMRRLHLSPESVETGSLPQLIDVQHAIAWDLLREFAPDAAQSKEQFLARFAPIRLDAFENYIRGISATAPPEKIKRFKEALRLTPEYSQATLQLARTYFDQKNYDLAAQWFARVPRNESFANEANFYLGLSCFYLVQFERAEEAFQFVANRIPLIEVYNNLGVVQARRNKKTAAGFFERAIEADSRDADYHFNLAASLYRAGDTAGAARQLKEDLALAPQDTEASALLEAINAGQSPAAAPLERIKRNYDETSYRQLALEIQNVKEQRFAGAPRPEHAAFHVQQGNELLRNGVNDLAENDFREAILLDPAQSEAHLGLARIMLARNDFASARTEAAAALRLKPSADAFALLGECDLQQNHPDAARESLDRALHLDANNPAALDLQRQLQSPTPH